MTTNMDLHSVCLAEVSKYNLYRELSTVGFLGVLLHYHNVAEFSVPH